MENYQRIEAAIRYLEENFHRQPSLAEIAGKVHLSEYHFQRLFTQWVGISPKKFIKYLTKEYAKQLLRESRSVLEAALESGLSGPGRLHDLFITCEAVTPGEYKKRGQGLKIVYGFSPSPFGECMLAKTEKGVCYLRFTGPASREEVLNDLKKRWPQAEIKHNSEEIAPITDSIFGQFSGSSKIKLHLLGTNFQIKVWEALLKIPPGYVLSYEDLARLTGKPEAVRAVASAVGRNPVPFVIPCHRIIRKSGEFGQYREGPIRKKLILGWEAAIKNGA